MDPLSAAANIIAVITVAQSVGQGLEKLASLRHVPAELFQLLDEVSDLQVVLTIVRENCLGPRPSNRNTDEYLKSALDKASEVITEIHEIFILGLVKNLQDIHNAPVNVSWKRWLKDHGRLSRLTAKLRERRQALISALTLTTASGLTGINVDLRNITLHVQRVDETTQQVLTTTGATNTTISEQQISLDALQGFLQNSHHLPGPASSLSANSQPTSNVTVQKLHVKTYASTGKSCSQFCACQCHKTLSIRSPVWLQGIIGLLFIGYSGVPLVGRARCSETRCKKERNKRITLNYYFPPWLLARMLCIRDTSTPLDGHMISVRTPRVVDRWSEVFLTAEMGNFVRLRELLNQGLASPFDVSAYNGWSVLAYCINMTGYHAYSSAIYTEIAKFLIDIYADPHLEDQRDMSPVQMFWDKILGKPADSGIIALKSVLSPYLDPDEDLKSRDFSRLHLIVLGYSPLDLETELQVTTADINKTCRFGTTPLHWAAAASNTRAVRLLLDYGASATIYDSRQKTAFDEAIRALGDSTETLQTLLDFYPMATHEDFAYFQSKYIKFWALSGGNKIARARLLLDYGASFSPHGLHKPWHPALLYGVQCDSHEVIALFLTRGSPRDLCNGAGENILHMAAQFCDFKTIDILANAAICCMGTEKQQEFGYTPLQCFDNLRSSRVREDEEARGRCREAFVRLLDGIKWRPERHFCKTTQSWRPAVISPEIENGNDVHGDTDGDDEFLMLMRSK